jgi:broad specificity phosphatase PhoE
VSGEAAPPRRGLREALTGGTGRAADGGPWDLPARRPGDRYLVLVRHGEAAAGWDGDADPGLSDLGRAQAQRVAAELAAIGPVPVVASPLRRTRETAAAIAAALGVDVAVEPAVGEVVAPPEHQGLAARGPWLQRAMAGTWADLGEELDSWRSGVVGALLALPGDTVVVTHFVAINAAVGAALGDGRVLCFRPGNCSTTILRAGDDGLHVARLGTDAVTEVL